jgi:cytidylate kinase
MSFYCQPEAFNVFLEVRDEIGAQRIFDQQRDDDESSSYDAVLAANQKRMEGQQATYLKLYEIDLFDMSHYDLVVDASDMTPEQVADAIEV